MAAPPEPLSIDPDEALICPPDLDYLTPDETNVKLMSPSDVSLVIISNTLLAQLVPVLAKFKVAFETARSEEGPGEGLR